MDDYTVIVSRRADEILIRHARFLAQVRVSAARQMTAEFAKVIDALEKNPFQFPPELDCRQDNRGYQPDTNSRGQLPIDE